MAYVTVKDFNTQLKKMGNVTLYSGTCTKLNVDNLERISGALEKFNFVDFMNVLSYRDADVQLSSSLSNLVYEIGITVYGGQTLTANVTRGSSPITKVEFFRNDTSVSTIVDDVSEGGTFTYASGTDISADETYKVVVTCKDGSVVENELTLRFYNPFYQGVTDKCLSDITTTNITTLTKDIGPKEAKSYSYTSNNLYCIIAYPKSYGQLSYILDGNGFQNIDSWECTEVEINSVPYYVYQTGTAVICNNFIYKFTF